MKKLIFIPILVLTVVAGLVFANRENRIEPSKKSISEPTSSATLSAEEKKAARKKWEATPGGIIFKKWEASPAGKKVYAAVAKISKPTKNFTGMEAVISSLSLPPGSRLGFGMMVKIDNEDYILSFGPEKSSEFEQLHKLKVKDKIIIKSRFVSFAPKYAYPIIAGEYIERNNEIIYKRPPNKGSC
ncbi:hypothetical protein [Lacihabitans soyangensis]|uniref:Uncharacterized protein n=1 Tax=Lacihabitans soyangensis TaxID=869394 RepID=A0AAE3H868_9BACT|nr:hypothetical protein [Lacihabitans soyangensis]MCP9766061.1 hypothetical protein [Lacihabitans soyangensis]